jgi:hypothetical protein
LPVSRKPDQLKPALHHAQAKLEQRLAEACDEHVAGESTGELIKLEEILTDAAQAAKQAISIRRRLGAEDSKVRDEGESETRDAETPAPPDRSALADLKPEGIREFADARGSQWHVWEVPAEQLASRARPGTYAGEFEAGWLAFECADGGQRRRLPGYPRDWRSLSDAELDALCRQARPVAPRKSRGTMPDGDDASAKGSS